MQSWPPAETPASARSSGALPALPELDCMTTTTTSHREAAAQGPGRDSMMTRWSTKRPTIFWTKTHYLRYHMPATTWFWIVPETQFCRSILKTIRCGGIRGGWPPRECSEQLWAFIDVVLGGNTITKTSFENVETLNGVDFDCANNSPRRPRGSATRSYLHDYIVQVI